MYTATTRGVDGHVVRVTRAVSGGLPMLKIVGLSTAAEREARVRVQAALASAGVELTGTTEVRCDAGGIALDGVGFDLPIAIALAGDNSDAPIGAIGELSLTGELRPVRGVLAAVEALSKLVSVVIVAPENALEAQLVDRMTVIAARTLGDALSLAKGPALAAGGGARPSAPSPETKSSGPALDLHDVRGQARACRALEIAAAGHHHVLLVGGPSTGKTMLARRLPGLLPPMTNDEALAVTRVHSAAGLNIGGGLVTARPFRAPHHSTTPPGLVGGGAALPRPGEVSLAHNGVLFLDELPEFARPTLEVLQEPLASGEVVLSRASGTLRFPSRCVVVASMLPCPCGHHGTPRCRCTLDATKRYTSRVPARLLELFDLRLRLESIDLARIDQESASGSPRESSAEVSLRVAAARARTTARALGSPLDATASATLGMSTDTVTKRERVLRLARTIADLAGEDTVTDAHVAEALELAGDITA